MRIGHVVYLSSAGCALWSWRGSGFVESGVRTPVGVDPSPVIAEIARLGPAPVGVLVDMIDEEHVREVVPRIGRRDQRALIERKLARAFPRTGYRSAEIQGRNPENPDEQQVLLSALTRPEPLRILMERLSAAKLPVAGVYSPALLTGRLLDAATREKPAVMLVLRRRNGRLQHSFFRHGRLAGSRRLRPPAAGDDAAGLLGRQIEESLRYFDATYSPTPEAPLAVLLPPDDCAAMRADDQHGAEWQLAPFDPQPRLKELGTRTDAGPADSERLLIALLRAPGRHVDLSPPEDRRYYRLFRARAAVRAACFLLAAAGVTGTLDAVLELVAARERAASSVATVSSLEAALVAPADDAAAGVDPIAMQAAVVAYEALRAREADPAALLAAVSAAVRREPGIRVDLVSWNAGALDAEEPADASTGETADDAGGEEATADGDAPASGGATAGSVGVTIRGRVAPFDGDYPRAFAVLQSFMDALREVPAVTAVEPLVQPLDVSPTSTLSGEISRDGTEPEAHFAVRVLMRHDDEAA